nr:immunoglobulin heavy chain junction region [Macaca mulatta]MOX38140.1 immunoglobulin heavy chain junction region [Macaca mulatta]MOX38484.1 immunoglobulin heavy chain junction region [Macaca mulatta]MOX38531.1 immunoglobulin heavy chain junction region [Macaca mulatta]MOX38683.1 immunoglobulin heavy chain junction region [Macaca mulatta]
CARIIAPAGLIFDVW